MGKPENNIILYQDENGVTRVNVRFSGEDLWLTQLQIAEIYDTTQQNIDQHIKNIYADSELELKSTYKNFLLVQKENISEKALGLLFRSGVGGGKNLTQTPHKLLEPHNFQNTLNL